MPEIPVTYQCWKCGRGITVYEDVEEQIPSITKWNLCPYCIDKNRSKKYENILDK